MINTSNEYKRYIADSADSTLSRDITTMADIEFADGMALNITEGDIVVKGLKIYDSTSKNNNFQIGSAIINQCSLMLNNIGGKFDQYDFTDAIIRPYIGLRLSETTEWLAKGVFTVDDPTVASSVISLVALDNMDKFDTPFSEVNRTFPCTSLQLLQSVCLHCGVSLTTVSFLNDDFIIARRPNDEAISCREIVSWIAQLSGNFARINTQGELELKWYDMSAFEQSDNLDGGIFDDSAPYSSGDSADGGNFTDYNSGDSIDGGTFEQMNRYHHIYALNQATIGTDDVVITGLEVKAMGTETDYGETVLFGTSGYVIRIDENPLITENTASVIANSVGAKIVGMRFRPCSISAISDPSREAGDVAYLSHKGNSYQILLTNVGFQIGSSDNISCDAETPSRNSSRRFSAQTKTIVEARNIVRQEINMYDLAVQQLNSVALNSMGYYPTTIIQEDGSRIDYAHDKPTLEESQIVYKKTIDGFFISKDGGKTYTSGVTADGNILANVLTAIGIKAEWLKVGGTISGLRIETDTGKIGPYNISGTGLSSATTELWDDDVYPSIWLRRRGTGGAFGVDGAGVATYGPDYVNTVGIEDGIMTDVDMRAIRRGTEEPGFIRIMRTNTSNGRMVSGQKINNERIEFEEYDSYGVLEKKTYFDKDLGMSAINYDTGKAVSVEWDLSDGSLHLQANKVYVNGREI